MGNNRKTLFDKEKQEPNKPVVEQTSPVMPTPINKVENNVVKEPTPMMTTVPNNNLELQDDDENDDDFFDDFFDN